MSKKNGNRAKVNRENKKRQTRRIRVQELRKTLMKSKVVESAVATIPDEEKQVINSRLRSLTGNAKTGATAFEIVVYRPRQGEKNE